jgi:iron(III) transport system substrate-binding protein
MMFGKKGAVPSSGVIVLLLAALLLAGCAGQEEATPASPEEISGTVVLYTAANEKMEATIIEGFQLKYPEINVERVNLSSGPITSRVIAEMGNPQADVIWGLFESYMGQLKEKGAIEPYAAKDVGKIDERFVDPDDFYFGHDLTLIVFGVNTDIIAENDLPEPETWEDLTDPMYEGMINVASPAESGTGMTVMTCLYDMHGGWDFIDELDKNIFQYNSSGGAAGRQAGRGEIAIGLTYDTAVFSLQNEGFPVKAVIPPNDCHTVETAGLISGAPHPELGKLFLDYLSSKDAMYRLANLVPVITRPDVVVVEEWKPKLDDLDLYVMKDTYDLEAFADEWLSRYTR